MRLLKARRITRPPHASILRMSLTKEVFCKNNIQREGVILRATAEYDILCHL